MHEEICYLDATELAARVRTGALSPVEITRAYLDRIEALNARLNAFVTLNPAALDEARAAEAAVRRGDRLGPLHGVPVSAKDCFDTAGLRTTRGSRLFADRVPKGDATAVSRLRQAGAVFLGKTNIPEFALSWETDNLVFGRTRNPWNPERIAGGSSGGEAAALAAGLTALGLGSDLGGSVRQPAHCCGVVGLKPTHGRVPLTGHWPDTILRAMHVGPLARTVRDLGLALSVLGGPDGHDPYAIPVPPVTMPEAPASVAGLRVGVSLDGGAAPVDPDVRRIVDAAARRLAALGCHVEPARIPALDERDWNVLTMTLYGAEAGSFLAPIVAGRTADLHPAIQRRLAFTVESLGQYIDALAEWERLRQETAAFFTRHDLLLGPCAPLPAHPHDLVEVSVEGRALPARHVLRATIPWDLTGSPALALSFGWSGDGLPIAVQLVGRHFDEATVLRAALALEASSAVAGRRPAL